jgi:hypothetical protein
MREKPTSEPIGGVTKIGQDQTICEALGEKSTKHILKCQVGNGRASV